MNIFTKLEEFTTPELCVHRAIQDSANLTVEFTAYDHRWKWYDLLIRQKLSEVCELSLISESNVGEYPEVQYTFNYQINAIFGIPIETLDKINSTPVPEGATLVSKGSYSIPGIIEEPPILKSNYREIWEDIDKMNEAETNNDCPDCSDGFYYPFNGPKEPCKTCGGPTPESCSECNGTNTILQHPEGTPGPCPSCNDSEIMSVAYKGR